jgi:hypothetical protein
MHAGPEMLRRALAQFDVPAWPCDEVVHRRHTPDWIHRCGSVPILEPFD